MSVIHSVVSGFKCASVKRISAAVLSLLFVFGAAAVFSAPLYSAENVSIPDLSGIKPFSREANYMSLEGFVICHCRINYGVDISRGEARKMIKEQKKALKASARAKSAAADASRFEAAPCADVVVKPSDCPEKENVRRRVDEILTRYHHKGGR